MNQSETEEEKCSRRQKKRENICAKEREGQNWFWLEIWLVERKYVTRKKTWTFYTGAEKFYSCNLGLIGFAY